MSINKKNQDISSKENVDSNITEKTKPSHHTHFKIKEEILPYTSFTDRKNEITDIIIDRPGYYKLNLEYHHLIPGISIIRDNSEFIRRYTSVEHVFEYRNPEDLLLIHYIVEGQGQIGVSEDKYIPSKSNDIQIEFMPKNSYYSYYDKLNAVHIVINIKEIQDDNIFSNEFKTILKRLFHDCEEEKIILLKSNNIILKLFKEMQRFQVDDQILKRTHSQTKIIEIIIYIYLTNLTTVQIEHRTYTDAQIRVVRKIKNHLSRDIASYISLEVLSMSYGINLTTLKNCFKDMYGKPLYTWYREYKFHRAKDLIQNTDFPISKIAHMVGYKSSSKFTKAFKKEMGVLPSSYRKK